MLGARSLQPRNLHETESQPSTRYPPLFIENYVFKIIYPPALNYEIQTYLGIILIFVNLVIYYYIVKKSRTGG